MLAMVQSIGYCIKARCLTASRLFGLSISSSRRSASQRFYFSAITSNFRSVMSSIA